MLRFFLRMFGAGLLPPEGHGLIDPDRNPLVTESMTGSITFRNFRAPGRYSLYRRQWFLGSLAVSKSRIVAYRYRSQVVNIPFDDVRIRQVHFSFEQQDRFLIQFDASLFQPSSSGEVEIRFTMPDAADVVSLINARINDLCPPAPAAERECVSG